MVVIKNFKKVTLPNPQKVVDKTELLTLTFIELKVKVMGSEVGTMNDYNFSLKLF